MKVLCTRELQEGFRLTQFMLSGGGIYVLSGWELNKWAAFASSAGTHKRKWYLQYFFGHNNEIQREKAEPTTAQERL